jgi:acyl-CoA thioesterase-1
MPVKAPFTRKAVPVKVACVGASDTEGGGSYPHWLGEMLGPGYEVRNFGRGGTTMLKQGDYPYWGQPVFAEARAWLPAIVTIMLGGNDSKPQNWAFKAEFVSDYKEMIGVFQNLASRPKIYLCTSLNVFKEGNFGITPQVVNLEVVPLIRQVALETGCPVIDTNQATLGLGAGFPDNVHPTPLVHKAIARTMFEALAAPQ